MSHRMAFNRRKTLLRAGTAHGKEAVPGLARPYQAGCWDERALFLPTLIGAQENKGVMLHFKTSIEERDLPAVRLLLHSGFPVGAVVGPRGMTALHLAVQAKDTLMCQLLLSFKADPHQKDVPQTGSKRAQAQSPLEMAKELDFTHLVSLLANSENKRPNSAGAIMGCRKPHWPPHLPLVGVEPGFMAPPLS